MGLTAVAGGAAPLIEHVASTATIGVTAIACASIVCGTSLLIGFLTPLAAALVAVGSVPALLDAKPATVFLIVMAVAVVLLGPGAFSLDSYLFGRREIVIPQFKKAASDRQAPLE